jgi:hypothetical protein
MRDVREFEYLIDASDRFVSANAHWFDFAKENGAHALTAENCAGRLLWEFISDATTRHLYKVLVKPVRERGEVRTVPYRCDSPDRRRYMEMTISNARQGGVLFRSRIIREEQREAVPLLAVRGKRSDDLVAMCSWCKKVRVREVEWLEIEAAVRELQLFHEMELPRITHTICDRCTVDYGFEPVTE